MFLLKCLILLYALSFIDTQFYYRPTAQSCGTPRILHGRARIRQRGNLIKYSCFSHYTLIGNKYATCRNGQWDVPPPVCIRSGCPQLETVKNAVNMTTHNNSWIVFFCLPNYELFGSSVVYCDGGRWNSTAPECIAQSEVGKVSTECDFEKPDICGWKLDELHDFDWRRWNKKTPSYILSTGPSFDHTYGTNGSGYYMYVESSDRVENETARLLSPVYDANLARNACFVFYYHMFGSGMGGLRVYQKPDKVTIGEILSEEARSNYTLFEQWGNQGNEWYTSVSMLTDYSDDFQIVIEGIRGRNYLSDIAIDDVSIQHGENCTRAVGEAVTPSSVIFDSCTDRCELYKEHPTGQGCGCSLWCVSNGNCCPDFFDLCMFLDIDGMDDSASSLPDYSVTTSSEAVPQTDKLVAATTSPEPFTTSTSATISNRRTTEIISTTSAPKISTIYVPTSTVPKIPTTRYYLRYTTRPTFVTTTKSPTKINTPPKTTTSVTTTTIKPTTKVVKSTTTTKPTTLSSEVTSLSSIKIFFVQTTKHEDERSSSGKDFGKKQQDDVEAKKPKGMSGVLVATLVLLGVALCCGSLWGLFVYARSTRGFMAVGRLRAHATNDSEVHYLKSDVEEF